MNNNTFIAPSLLSANFANLDKSMETVSHADWFHLDIMDGMFVPNITFGQNVVKAIRTLTGKPLDVHLMIMQPERYIESFKIAGADIITIHVESTIHVHRIVHAIKDLGIHVGVALNPSTNVNSIADILEDVDMVLIMSVNPGFGGQKFIEHTYDKLKQLQQLRNESQRDFLIEVDGGVNMGNIVALRECGVDAFVAGNSIFASSNPNDTIDKMKALVELGL